ncbi:unnamed protein product (macronuclear) [Paramecium tetraurelia]|uniref:NADH:flavin oxidoreductase/NADH oxidase N-terminal domain-containing protein n=1 Tax=Paramecium tetraurelia TaxID=5888 RepID=A0CIU9_PARTE|nr:uncharacterized protein GSPATT00007851001 [Paramecium tetraurelia]CAK70716.1 unnamed protein product [Paramecium tetraurelia]|eukprot:XP_001438113.1 hypothetical protein (macronuclear) [Paramecium tetraurelia strain d4-2]
MEKSNTPYQALFQPYKLGLIERTGCFSTTVVSPGLECKNRITLSAMTRGRCGQDLVPTNHHAEYYAQRAAGGFTVTESASISDRSLAYGGAPGIFNDAHTEGWKKVVDKVHSVKGNIFIQLLHCGRQTHSSLQNGQTPLAPSAVRIRGQNQIVKKDFEVPQEMTIQDINLVVKQYKEAAERARKAGFDGVELNAGHGHLPDQFLRDSANKRTDSYGGSAQNRCKFLLEVVQQLVDVFGAGRVGVKLTPVTHHGDMNDSNPLELYQTLLRALSNLKIAYVVLKNESDPENFQDFGYPASKKQIPCVYSAFRNYFTGAIVANGGITLEEADEGIRTGKFDFVAFGQLFISNPDLVDRARNGYQLNRSIDWGTAFYGDQKGYTDYPKYQVPSNILTELMNPLKINDLFLPNRITMSPMDRVRTPAPYIPTELNVKYYAQRATAGLIVCEATPVSQRSMSYPGSPCIYNDDQAKGWALVTKAVHDKGGRLFLQLFHGGRKTHSSLQNGLEPWAPSAIAIRGNCYSAQNKPFEKPHEMTEAEIQFTLQEFVDAAKRAKTAGFDGVEINGGNGHLPDQFLRDSANKRTDQWGGSVENRCKFVIQLIQKLNTIFPGRVSIKLTPIGHTGDMNDSNPIQLYTYLLQQLSKLNLAYVTLVEDKSQENADGHGYPASDKQIQNLYKSLRPHYKGILFANHSITPERANQDIKDGLYDAVSFGQLYINNPDLVYRVRNGFQLNTNFDFKTYFGGDEKGYTDFPTFEEEKKQ